MLAKALRKWPYLIIAALLALLILAPFDWFLGQYRTLMIFIGLSTMVTVGLCLLLGYTGQVSLGQAAFYGLGAYFSAVLSKNYYINPWLAMLIAAMATVTFAYVIGYPIFRLRGNYLAMATLGIGIIMWILFRQLSQFTGGPDGMTGIPFLSIGGFAFESSFRRYFLVWGFCLAVLLISQNIVNSRTGRALRAIHGSEAAAESIGINVAQFKVKIFVLSAVFASLAGSLFVHHLRFVSPQPFDFFASVKLVVMAVIGGLASVWGAIFGAGATRILSDELLLRFGEWDVVIYGAILMLVMIFMPEGLFVKLKDIVGQVRSRFERRGAES
ncbi:MAG: branched-chain amino acid ABC transporter permease [Dehalococcoidia bacterium]|nr:MAG: branched-chain amino acid ABC transporter permease [Dehalococcoidia bacterium]